MEKEKAILLSTKTRERCTSGTVSEVGTVVHDSERTRYANPASRRFGLLPFISIVYILNGNHDPRKVQAVNIFLASAFYVAGAFTGLDLQFVALLFGVVAVINAVNLWYIGRRGGSALPSKREDILSQIELWPRRGVHHRTPQ